MCVFILEPFPPPDDFRLRSIFLQRLWFTWTVNETYRNCASLTNIYVTNCTSTCKFSSDRITIICSDISTIARICQFQLQYSICDDTEGSASDPIYVSLKGRYNCIMYGIVNYIMVGNFTLFCIIYLILACGGPINVLVRV